MDTTKMTAAERKAYLSAEATEKRCRNAERLYLALVDLIADLRPRNNEVAVGLLLGQSALTDIEFDEAIEAHADAGHVSLGFLESNSGRAYCRGQVYNIVTLLS